MFFKTETPAEYLILMPIGWLVLAVLHFGFRRLALVWLFVGIGQFFALEYIFRGSEMGRKIELGLFLMLVFIMNRVAVRRANARLWRS